MQEEATKARILRAHRERLADNPAAYTEDLSRIRVTVVDHLKEAGYRRVTKNRCGSLVDEFVNLIFETQDRLPFFHIDSPLPYCWNAPRHFYLNYIRYE